VTHNKFLQDVEVEFCRLFEQLNGKSAVVIHQDSLKKLRPHIKKFQSHQSCFCCLLRTPEKVLDCGDAFCDVCIKTFGSQYGSEPNRYELPECTICGEAHSSTFTFIPPTAGIRLLSLDGGGVRGIIQLTVLEHLERELVDFGCPLEEYFDSVVGTSSGKQTTHYLAAS
jgi:hypothetical protein